MTTTINVYDVGDKVKVQGTFWYQGVETDPTNVVVKYRNGVGAITTLIYGEDIEVTKESTGVYSFEILATASGIWKYRMDDGLLNTAAEGNFEVRKSNF